MSNETISQDQFDSFDDDMAFSSFEKFANERLFDFNDASCDSTFLLIESDNKPPTSTTNDVSLVDVDQPGGLHSGFFASAFTSDDTFGNLHNDMSIWPADIVIGQSEGTQCENWSSPPTFHPPTILPASPSTTASPVTQHPDVLPATPPGQSIGPIEALWRPVMGFSPPTKTPPRLTRPRAPSKPKTSKTKATKVTKKKKPATGKRTSSASESSERSMQELYNAAWDNLSQEEKGRLLLPLLQGIDPNTGEKTVQAGTLLGPVDFEAIGAHVSGNYPPTSSPAAKTTSSGHSSSPNTADYSAIGADYSPPTSNQTAMNNADFEAMGAAFVSEVSQDEDSTIHMLTALKAFNKSCDSTADITSSDIVNESASLKNINTIISSDIDANTTIGRGLGGPCGNGMIGGPVQMPAPPSVYGCTRQQEALQRNAMLRAQGRRR